MKRAAIIGAGPAGLIAAERLGEAGIAVDVFDRMPSVGRKFLMAGRGGLNLTHSEPLDAFLARYRPVSRRLVAAIRAFPPDALRAWAHGLGQETFIGSSGRVFPKSMKASPLLRAWLGRLQSCGIRFHLRHDWRGWDGAGRLLFTGPSGAVTHETDATVLATGGASWPRLGADGGWAAPLADAGIRIAPLRAANAGVLTRWSDHFAARHAGSPLKRIHARIGADAAEGEAVITASGLEGGIIYALSRPIRAALDRDGTAQLLLDLRPDFRPEWIADRLNVARAKDSLASRLRKAAGLQPNAVSLAMEAALAEGRPLAARAPAAIAAYIRALPLTITGIAGLDRAISTAGGVAFAELTGEFMLRRRPGIFVAGEMLDWEAPTGGYLLQACFATGVAAAEGMIRYLIAQR